MSSIARSAVRPTIAARTLDISAGGEAGVDWANVGTQGSTVSLTATTVATVTTTTTATNVTTVNGLAANVITATSINADAITAAKIADGAIDALTFAAGAINAAAIAVDAIGASELAADAITEIQAGLATPTNITAGIITTVTNLTNAPTAGDLTATMKTSVKTQVTDSLNVDTYAEPGQGTPLATTTLVGKIGYLYKNWRNHKTQTSTTFNLFNDDALTVDQKATVADDATTASKTEIATGP